MGRIVLGVGVAPVMIAMAFGMIAGLGGYTFHYGEGTSYLSNRPESCINCHIMQPQYDSWMNSSHHAVAACTDCHMPDETLHGWFAKADNGFFHSWAFTFDDFHEPIQIKPRNQRIVQNNCLRCHSEMVHEMLPVAATGQMPSCVTCHAEVGHAGARAAHR